MINLPLIRFCENSKCTPIREYFFRETRNLGTLFKIETETM